MLGIEVAEYVPYLKLIEEYAKLFAEFTKANPVVGGMFGVWLLGVVTFFLRGIPNKVIGFCDRYMTVSLSLNSAHESFHDVLEWYEKHKNIKNDRTIRVTNGKHGWDDTQVSVGLGYHYFFHRKWLFKLSRYIQSSDGGEKVKEEITIKTIGFTQKKLIALIKETVPERKERENYVYTFNEGGWDRGEILPKRPWNSVILKTGQKDRILNFIEDFQQSKDWYTEMGISYKTGILLSGPPGTGKTSMIKALADHLKQNLGVISCGTLTEAGFLAALTRAPKNTIILMEDFDSIKATESRVDKKDEGVEYGITLSGLLNSIDGVFSSEGRILIATTNHKEKLDPAILRPGRFDLKEVIDNADEDMIIRMFKKFYPDYELNSIKFNKGISLAQVENVFLMNKKDPIAAKKEVEKLKVDKNPKKKSMALPRVERSDDIDFPEFIVSDGNLARSK